MFAAEYESLQMLGKVGAIRVPILLAISDSFIIMEAIDFHTPGDNWHEQMGQ